MYSAPLHRSYSGAGYADLPLTLLGAPLNIGETRVTVSWLSPRPRRGAALPGQDRMWPSGIIEVVT
jgi:hypothetical protein